MKKLIAMFLSVLMLASLATAAFAEASESSDGTATVQIDYITLSKDEYTYEGGVDTNITDVGLTIWLPEYLFDGVQELTEEDEDRGFLAKMQDVEGGPLAFSIVELGTDQVESLEQYAGYLLTHEGYANVQMAEINGIDAVLYYMPDMDMEAVSFHMTNNNILEFYFTPASDEACSDLIRAMICSIVVTEEE